MLCQVTSKLKVSFCVFLFLFSVELSGIFVKSIAEGSTAAVDGRLRINDQIIEVDDISLHGKDNQQAVEILKQTGAVVRLRVARHVQHRLSRPQTPAGR